MASSKTPPVGSLFVGRYRIEAALGQGGMGVVLAALDERTGIECAIKLLAADALESDTARLLREARALMLLGSPHVVRVFDVGESASLGPYLVLERLKGSDLAKLTPPGKRLELGVVAAIALQVCDALAQAHAIGIIHRDIKPSNLFLTRGPDGSDIVKVLDFGVSKLKAVSHWDAQPTLTAADGPLGSPQFISPEQLADARSVDGRTDLWSLGVVIYRLLTGAYPFDGASVAETFAAVLRAPIAPLAEHGVVVPPEFQAVLDRCLQRDVDSRIASATELAAALRPFAGGSASPAIIEELIDPTAPTKHARTMTTLAVPRPPSRSVGRRLAGWGLLGVGCLGVLGLARLLGFRAGSPSPPPPVLVVTAPSETADLSGEVALHVSAPAPILTLRAKGLRRLVIDGREARAYVSPWSGALEIEAELEGGGRAHGGALAVETGGPTSLEIELVRERGPASAIGTGTAVTAPPAPVGSPRGGHGPKRGLPPASAPTPGPPKDAPKDPKDESGSELRRNPYL